VFNRILQKLYQINSPDAVTLGGAYEGVQLLQYVYRVTRIVAVGSRLALAVVTWAIRAEDRGHSIICSVS